MGGLPLPPCFVPVIDDILIFSFIFSFLKLLYTFSLLVKLISEDPDMSDINDLKKYGVLIFISDNEIEVGRRIKFIEDHGNFGESRLLSPLDQWEPEEDVSLYLIRQPIEELPSLMDFLRYKEEDLYRRVMSQEIYFVLNFGKNEWQRNQVKLLKYDFFQNAKTIFFTI